MVTEGHLAPRAGDPHLEGTLVTGRQGPPATAPVPSTLTPSDPPTTRAEGARKISCQLTRRLAVQ